MVVALPDDAVGGDLDAHRAQVVAKAPMGRRDLALEQPGGGVEPGSGAHRGRPPAAGSRGPQPVDQGAVAHDRHGILTSGDDDQVGVGQRLRRVRWDHGQPAITPNRLERSREEVNLRVGQAADDLVGADEVDRDEVLVRT